MATPQDRYIKIGNINTRYWEEGHGGPAVVLIHGLGASADIWMHNISALAESHRVYAPDLVGFGRTEKPDVTYSPSYIAAFLDDFMTALGIEYPILIGLSLGGGVALQYTLQFPGRVDRLVLVDSAGLGRELPLPMRLATIPLLGELMLTPSRSGMAFVLRQLVYDPSVITDGLIDLYCELNFSERASKTVLFVLRACATVGGARSEVIDPILKNLGNITIPTLVIWGREDHLFPLGHACSAVEKIPDSHLYIFDRCGHMPNLERPKEFNSLVLKFLDGHALHS
ncbi:MAG TPA: alpha/beta fold hydrolase [Syntrophales bacterium]|nr:alpha/beta fold hydrolase [Syntrophales bacterium]